MKRKLVGVPATFYIIYIRIFKEKKQARGGWLLDFNLGRMEKKVKEQEAEPGRRAKSSGSVPCRRNAGRGAGTAELEPFPAGPSEEGAGARGLWRKSGWPREQAARFLLRCDREKGTRALRLSKQSAVPSSSQRAFPCRNQGRGAPGAALLQLKKKIRKGLKKNKPPGSFSTVC